MLSNMARLACSLCPAPPASAGSVTHSGPRMPSIPPVQVWYGIRCRISVQGRPPGGPLDWGGEGGCDGVIVEGSGVVGFEVRDRRVGRQDQGRERGKHGGMRGALPGGGTYPGNPGQGGRRPS